MTRTPRTFIAPTVVLLIVVLALCNWQKSFAQPPQENVPAENELPHVIKIPPTGYKPAPESDESEKGRQLFQDLNCMACHSLHNAGGDIAPALDGVGGRRNESFMIAHLSNSAQARKDYQNIRGVPADELFPHFRCPPETARQLVAYLETLPEPPGGFVVMPHTVRLPRESTFENKPHFVPSPRTANSAEGEKMFNKFGCIACHSIAGVGGWFGPKLDGVGARCSPGYITAQVTDAQAHAELLSQNGNEVESKMPRFNISADEARKITDYLLTLPSLK